MTLTEDRLAAALRTGADRFTASPDLGGTLVRGRRIRHRRFALTGVAAVLVVTGIATTLRSATSIDGATGSARGPFRPIATGPLATRVGSSMVSLGSAVFVWGGQAAPDNDTRRTPQASGLLADGAIYSPASDSWRRISASPLPGRVGAPVVVTQAGVLVLGGSRGGDLLTADRTDGALYDPVGDTWTMVPDAPLCVHEAVAQGRIVYAAGTACNSGGTPAFGILDAMTGVWKSGSVPAFGLQHLLPYHGTVIAIGRLGETAELSSGGSWTRLPSVPATGPDVPQQTRVTDFVTASSVVNVLVVGQVDFGDRGTVVYALSEGRWTEVGRYDQHSRVEYPARFGVQAAISGDLLVWHGLTGLSWFSLTTHRADFAPTAASAAGVVTPTPLVPVDGFGFLWWGGHTGERVPRTDQPLSAGALVTINP
jgi:hypothetical protein